MSLTIFKKITNLTLAISLVTGSNVSYAQWIKVYESTGMIVFMDVISLAAPIDNRVVNVLTDFREPESEDDDLVSMINQVEFFCEKRLRRILSGAHYAQNMGQGKPTYEQTMPGKLKPIRDRDGWDPVVKIVCNPNTL